MTLKKWDKWKENGGLEQYEKFMDDGYDPQQAAEMALRGVEE